VVFTGRQNAYNNPKRFLYPLHGNWLA